MEARFDGGDAEAVLVAPLGVGGAFAGDGGCRGGVGFFAGELPACGVPAAAGGGDVIVVGFGGALEAEEGAAGGVLLLLPAAEGNDFDAVGTAVGVGGFEGGRTPGADIFF